MKEKYPLRKVGLVTFTDDVDIIGDGSKDIINIKEMNDYDIILKNGIVCASSSFEKPIAESYNSLDSKV
jgi:hypothetical protein